MGKWCRKKGHLAWGLAFRDEGSAGVTSVGGGGLSQVGMGRRSGCALKPIVAFVAAPSTVWQGHGGRLGAPGGADTSDGDFGPSCPEVHSGQESTTSFLPLSSWRGRPHAVRQHFP